MPICKECGFTSSRLQWTHFKYKCTGKFKNGEEYQIAYPDSKLVDDHLAKKTAVTLDNLKKKYGDKIGQIKWDEYRKKQAYTNSFEYKKEKFGWTEDQFKEYNLSRAVTLENMVERHGEEVGLIKWDEYCDRQKFTKSKTYLIEKYGVEQGIEKYLEINRKKSEPHDPKILSEKLGISLDDAVSLICNRGTYKYTSLLEQEFIKLLETQIGPLEHSSLKNPFGKWCHLLNRYVVYDIKHKDCIIEFNGDYWHANPKKYHNTDRIRGIPVKDIWNFDLEKINLVKNSGYRVMVIWESEFLDNKIETIEKVKQWILNEQL
jgi:hypothetical protein